MITYGLYMIICTYFFPGYVLTYDLYITTYGPCMITYDHILLYTIIYDPYMIKYGYM